MRNVLTAILGGGQGARLWPLTRSRAKPAVPVGGKFRLIDIPISNSLHADVRRIFVLTLPKCRGVAGVLDKARRVHKLSIAFLGQSTDDSTVYPRLRTRVCIGRALHKVIVGRQQVQHTASVEHESYGTLTLLIRVVPTASRTRRKHLVALERVEVPVRFLSKSALVEVALHAANAHKIVLKHGVPVAHGEPHQQLPQAHSEVTESADARVPVRHSFHRSPRLTVHEQPWSLESSDGE